MLRSTFLLLASASIVLGHGRVTQPASRASAWRLGFPTPANYDDDGLNCGGFSTQWSSNGGKCGLCGDSYSIPPPRPHELGGTYGLGVIVAKYLPGATIATTTYLTASHMGYWEFKLCPDPTVDDQACFDKHTLVSEDGETKYYPTRGSGVYEVNYKLPSGLVCEHCVLLWRYVAGNNWGICSNGTSGLGCGNQEEFRACSDIAIGMSKMNNEIENIPSPLMYYLQHGFYELDQDGHLTRKDPKRPRPPKRPTNPKPSNRQPKLPPEFSQPHRQTGQLPSSHQVHHQNQLNPSQRQSHSKQTSNGQQYPTQYQANHLQYQPHNKLTQPSQQLTQQNQPFTSQKQTPPSHLNQLSHVQHIISQHQANQPQPSQRLSQLLNGQPIPSQHQPRTQTEYSQRQRQNSQRVIQTPGQSIPSQRTQPSQNEIQSSNGQTKQHRPQTVKHQHHSIQPQRLSLTSNGQTFLQTSQFQKQPISPKTQSQRLTQSSNKQTSSQRQSYPSQNQPQLSNPPDLQRQQNQSKSLKRQKSSKRQPKSRRQPKPLRHEYKTNHKRKGKRSKSKKKKKAPGNQKTKNQRYKYH